MGIAEAVGQRDGTEAEAIIVGVGVEVATTRPSSAHRAVLVAAAWSSGASGYTSGSLSSQSPSQVFTVAVVSAQTVSTRSGRHAGIAERTEATIYGISHPGRDMGAGGARSRPVGVTSRRLRAILGDLSTETWVPLPAVNWPGAGDIRPKRRLDRCVTSNRTVTLSPAGPLPVLKVAVVSEDTDVRRSTACRGAVLACAGARAWVEMPHQRQAGVRKR